MKKLIILLMAAMSVLVSCGTMNKVSSDASAELAAAIAAQKFNVVLTQTVVQPGETTYESFTTGEYIIKINGETASVNIPQLQTRDIKCQYLGTRKGEAQFKLTPSKMDMAGSVIMVYASANGGARVNVTWMTMNYRKYLGETVVPSKD